MMGMLQAPSADTELKVIIFFIVSSIKAVIRIIVYLRSVQLTTDPLYKPPSAVDQVIATVQYTLRLGP